MQPSHPKEKRVELLAPAGSLEKLKYAYLYGADAAYAGINGFSLRLRSEALSSSHIDEICKIKGSRKLYCTLNTYLPQKEFYNFEKELETVALFPFDAFIVSDMGTVATLKSKFPNRELHLSTQANCLNSEAVKFYRDAGFSRIILGREAGLKDIEAIKKDVPDIKIEVFVHGAMCLAYSGRCFLSRWMVNRSGNSGDCAHSCRWNYRLKALKEGTVAIEEQERPGELFPVEEGEGFTSILSSKDLCMIDYLKELKECGVDSFKIEGRMKSLYYAAIVTRAYRKGIDRLYEEVKEFEKYREEIYKVSHREFSTGFYFGKEEIEAPTEESYRREYLFLGTIGLQVSGVENRYSLNVKNPIRSGDELEFIGPDTLTLKETNFKLFNSLAEEVFRADHGKEIAIETSVPIKEGYIVRKKA